MNASKACARYQIISHNRSFSIMILNQLQQQCKCSGNCVPNCSNVKKVAHTRLLSVGFRSWSRFLAVSLQVTWVINPAVGCHYFSPGLQLPSQPLRGMLPVLLLGEQRHDGCEQFAEDCYPTASRLWFEPGPSAPESSTLTTRLPSHPVLPWLRKNSFERNLMRFKCDIRITFHCYVYSH